MRKLLIICCLILSYSSNAQLTEIFVEEDQVYKNAWELFIKEKYSAAKDEFSQYLEEKKGTAHNRISASFYVAVCAYELFHPDAEILLSKLTSILVYAVFFKTG